MKKQSVMVGGLALVLAIALSGPAFARGGGGAAGGMGMGSSAGAGAGFTAGQGTKGPGWVPGDRLQDRERLRERSQRQERIDDPARQRSGTFSGEQGQETADRRRLRNPDLHQEAPPTAE